MPSLLGDFGRKLGLTGTNQPLPTDTTADLYRKADAVADKLSEFDWMFHDQSLGIDKKDKRRDLVKKYHSIAAALKEKGAAPHTINKDPEVREKITEFLDDEPPFLPPSDRSDLEQMKLYNAAVNALGMKNRAKAALKDAKRELDKAKVATYKSYSANQAIGEREKAKDIESLGGKVKGLEVQYEKSRLAYEAAQGAYSGEANAVAAPAPEAAAPEPAPTGDCWTKNTDADDTWYTRVVDGTEESVWELPEGGVPCPTAGRRRRTRGGNKPPGPKPTAGRRTRRTRGGDKPLVPKPTAGRRTRRRHPRRKTSRRKQ